MKSIARLPFGLRVAGLASTRSTHRTKHVGCAYIIGNKIISGANSEKTSPLAAKLGTPNGKIHAEIAVLRNVEAPAKGHLYVIRFKKDGSLGMARPCKACMRLLMKLEIKIVTYSINKGFTTEEL